jgi:opacity protein-like surface antigen
MNVSATGFGTLFSATSSHAFFTVGGGIDVAIWGGLSGRIEYLFLDTGSITDNVATALGPVTVNSTVHDNIVRVGANYRF